MHDITTQELLHIINHERNKRNIGSLVISKKLTQAALYHAFDMNKHDFFSHHGNDGADVFARVRRTKTFIEPTGELICKEPYSKNITLKVIENNIVNFLLGAGLIILFLGYVHILQNILLYSSAFKILY